MARQIKIKVLSKKQLEAQFVCEHPDAFREPAARVSEPVIEAPFQPRIVPAFGHEMSSNSSVGVG